MPPTPDFHSIALTDLRIRGRGARWSSKPRRAWAWGRSRRAAGPAEADEWTLYQPRETERWWAPLSSSWRTSAAAEPPADGAPSFNITDLHSKRILYSSRRPQTYSEDSGSDGVDEQGFLVVFGHLQFQSRQSGVHRFTVIHIQPPQDPGPTCHTHHRLLSPAASHSGFIYFYQILKTHQLSRPPQRLWESRPEPGRCSGSQPSGSETELQHRNICSSVIKATKQQRSDLKLKTLAEIKYNSNLFEQVSASNTKYNTEVY